MTHRTLIDATETAAHRDDPGWVIVDCRFSLADPAAGYIAYQNGHLPGAVHADLERDLSGPVTPETGRHPLPDPRRLADRFGAWGIGPGIQVVVYDDVGGAFASRLWWSLRWLGHEDVALLDGGLGAWVAAGFALSTALSQPTPRVFGGKVCPEFSTIDTVELQALSAGLLLDARSRERYRGEQEPIDPVAGHIPGAVSAPVDGNLGSDGRFLPTAALRERFERLLAGAAPTAVIHYCGSGVMACHNLLAMEHAGLTGSRLYPGSWSEWIRDPSRPIELGG